MDAACQSETPWVLEERRDDTAHGHGLSRADNARNIVEALGNLCYLINLDAENPALVRSYTAQAEERLRAMTALLQDSVQHNPRKGLKLVPTHTCAPAD